MTILICIGASCQDKGSRLVVEGLQNLIREYDLGDKVKLRGMDCMGQCQLGVCVSVEDIVCSVTPETVDAFFREHVLSRM